MEAHQLIQAIREASGQGKGQVGRLLDLEYRAYAARERGSPRFTPLQLQQLADHFDLAPLDKALAEVNKDGLAPFLHKRGFDGPTVLRTLRRGKGIKQKQAADCLGVVQSAYSNYERELGLTIPQLYKLAQLLGEDAKILLLHLEPKEK